MDKQKPVYDMTDFEYAQYLETLAQDLEEAGNNCTSADVYEAMRRIKCLCGAYE
tara:strand:+ start:433 stop:594 length:162 start_codon:yes stop_codon:yes gene_type:complete